MGLVPEQIKDWLGVVDDAEDFTERIDKEAQDLYKMAQKLEKSSDEFYDAMNDTSRIEDKADAVKFIKAVEGHAPYLLADAKSFAREFRKVEREIDRLKGLVSKLPSMSEQRQAQKNIRDGEEKLKDLKSVSIKLIRVYDEVVRDYNADQNKWRMAIAGGWALGAATTAPFGTVAGIVKGAQEGRAIMGGLVGMFAGFMALWYVLKKAFGAMKDGMKAALKKGAEIVG